MKKLLLLTVICGMIISACSSNSSNKNVQDTTPALNQTGNDNQSPTDTMGANAGSTPSSVNEKGKDLIARLDCSTCHKEHDKLVGPAYASIAAKYPVNDKNIDYLASKIIAGGSGAWGDVAMTPHPAVAKTDAKEIVKYILSIK
jgi:cytochrome c